MPAGLAKVIPPLHKNPEALRFGIFFGDAKSQLRFLITQCVAAGEETEVANS
jgi:hypothetical protein